MSESEKVAWYMKVLHLNEADAVLYIENAIQDIVDIFSPSETKDPNPESIPVVQHQSA